MLANNMTSLNIQTINEEEGEEPSSWLKKKTEQNKEPNPNSYLQRFNTSHNAWVSCLVK